MFSSLSLLFSSYFPLLLHVWLLSLSLFIQTPCNNIPASFTPSLFLPLRLSITCNQCSRCGGTPLSCSSSPAQSGLKGRVLAAPAVLPPACPARVLHTHPDRDLCILTHPVGGVCAVYIPIQVYSQLGVSKMLYAAVFVFDSGVYILIHSYGYRLNRTS